MSRLKEPRGRAPDLGFIDGRIPPVQHLPDFHTVLTSPFGMSLDAFEARFGFNDRRLRLVAGLKAYVEATAALDPPPMLQLVSGSFVDDVEAPGDIDVVNIVETAPPDAIPLLYNKAFTRPLFGVDVCTVLLRGDPLKDTLTLLSTANYYSHRRDGLQRSLIWLYSDHNRERLNPAHAREAASRSPNRAGRNR